MSVPFRSEKQRRFLHATQPKLAQKWEKKYGSKPVAVKKSAIDYNPLTGDPLSMMRVQDFGFDAARGIPASQIPVPYSTIDYENVVRPDYRFDVGKITTEPQRFPGISMSQNSLDEYLAALERAERGNYPKLSDSSNYDRYMADVFGGYLREGSGDRGDTVVEPKRGLFFTPGNLQDLGSAEVTSAYEAHPTRLVGVSSNPLGEGIDIRPPGAQQELLNEIFVNRDIPGEDVFDLTPVYTRDRDYNPSWYNRGMDPEDAYREERQSLTRQSAPDVGQIQAAANILNTTPSLYHRPIEKPLRFDERTLRPLMENANKYLSDRRRIPSYIFQLPNEETGEMEFADPGPMMDFLREKVNLRPMDRAYREVMERAKTRPSFTQRTFGAPREVVSQTLPVDELNLQDEENILIPPEFVDRDPRAGFMRQGVDIDDLIDRDRRTRFNVSKSYSDTSISLESLDSGMGYEACSCCSPMQQASMALLDGYFEKAKKKSKPFHGYNPKRHHKKGGLNAAGRAKFKRETGANLKPPVTTKPSKLKPGSKRAKRRKSFCARMSGSKGPTSKDGKLTPKGAALKRWNC